MNLALISPKGVGMGKSEHNLRTAKIYESLSNIDSLKELMSCPNAPLLTIASIAKPYFDEITYIDEEIDPIDFSKHYDMVGMSFMTQQASRAYELADIFQDMGIYTVAGGMHPTNLPEQTLEHFHTVFIGEGEVTWHEFMYDFLMNQPKRVYRNTVEIKMEDTLMPAYELLQMDQYKTIPVQISRGCPHNCSFCASTKVYGPKYRHKKVDQVIAEIEKIKTLNQHPHIYFTDDNMLVQEDFSSELLMRLQGLGIRWMTHTDIGVADHDEILKLLAKSGCRKIVIGFESVVSESLKSLERWKYMRLHKYGDCIKKIQSYGIGVWGTFIVGLDGDDKSVFQRVVDFALNNKLYGAMISVPTPFPGSKLFDELEEQNRILTKHWGSYTLWNVVVKPKNMTVQELEDGFEYTLKSIYSEQASKERMNYFKHIYSERIELCSRGKGLPNN